MIPHLVPEIEGGYPERDGEEEEEGGEGLVLENSRSWICSVAICSLASFSAVVSWCNTETDSAYKMSEDTISKAAPNPKITGRPNEDV